MHKAVAANADMIFTEGVSPFLYLINRAPQDVVLMFLMDFGVEFHSNIFIKDLMCPSDDEEAAPESESQATPPTPIDKTGRNVFHFLIQNTDY